MEMEFDLKPRHIDQVSFKGRCKVLIDYKHKMVFLKSYGMRVAAYDMVTDKVRIYDLFSSTTTKHMIEFLFQLTDCILAVHDLRELIEKPLTLSEIREAY